MERVHVALAITGMTCGHCVAAVKMARAVVACDPSRTAVEMLLKATAEGGHPSSPAAG